MKYQAFQHRRLSLDRCPTVKSAWHDCRFDPITHSAGLVCQDCLIQQPFCCLNHRLLSTPHVASPVLCSERLRPECHRAALLPALSVFLGRILSSPEARLESVRRTTRFAKSRTRTAIFPTTIPGGSHTRLSLSASIRFEACLPGPTCRLRNPASTTTTFTPTCPFLRPR